MYRPQGTNHQHRRGTTPGSGKGERAAGRGGPALKPRPSKNKGEGNHLSRLHENTGATNTRKDKSDWERGTPDGASAVIGSVREQNKMETRMGIPVYGKAEEGTASPQKKESGDHMRTGVRKVKKTEIGA